MPKKEVETGQRLRHGLEEIKKRAEPENSEQKQKEACRQPVGQAYGQFSFGFFIFRHGCLVNKFDPINSSVPMGRIIVCTSLTPDESGAYIRIVPTGRLGTANPRPIHAEDYVV